MSKQLWPAIYTALGWCLPKEDATAQDRLNRLAREYFPELQTWLGEGTCTVRIEALTPAAFSTVQARHPRIKPRRSEDPIVLFKHLEKLVVIDGNNRVNVHRRTGAQESIFAMIIELKSGHPYQVTQADAGKRKRVRRRAPARRRLLQSFGSKMPKKRFLVGMLVAPLLAATFYVILVTTQSYVFGFPIPSSLELALEVVSVSIFTYVGWLLGLPFVHRLPTARTE